MADIVIVAVVAVVVGFTVYRFIKKQKSGGGCSCGGESTCGQASSHCGTQKN